MNAETNTMIGFSESLAPGAFEARQGAIPVPESGELVVRVEAVSVNPVDVMRRSQPPAGDFGILGYDAAGVVTAVGAGVDGFSVGDEVFYAGSLAMAGSNQRFQRVASRLVGHKPRSVTFGEAASLPLTALTAWETAFDRFGLKRESAGDLLVVGATGGVGSILTQLVRTLAPEVRVIATASAANADWARTMGAHEVVDHHGDLASQVQALAPRGVSWLFTAHSSGQVETYARVVAPFGTIVAIDNGPRDVSPLMQKSIAWLWELMFTDPLFLPDSRHQQWILDQVAGLVDSGVVRATSTTNLGTISADSLERAHAAIATGRTVGKIVLEGWAD
ncbi:zinc-binding alcohol dehydrogenase family protein [Microbacterium gorillae]|uniref:zinc-binding alcohol dehydrogenase family protein n=1 Tax=Microbacterium gorillae TaxID=1231063 RepID=UPI003D97FD9C